MCRLFCVHFFILAINAQFNYFASHCNVFLCSYFFSGCFKFCFLSAIYQHFVGLDFNFLALPFALHQFCL